MSATICESSLCFGAMPESELPKLPEGFRYEITDGDWVFAISPDGERYYVESVPPRLVRCSVVTVDDVLSTKLCLKFGQRFYDQRETINL